MKQGITLVVAMTSDYVIGISNQLPWRLSAVLKRFRTLSLNGCVVMGRKTFESIGRPLPQRTNVVVTRRGMESSADIRVAGSLQAAIGNCLESNKQTFVIGGGELYKEALPLASRIHLTLIETHEMKLPLFSPFEGDAHFPPLSPNEWAISRLGRRNVARPKGRPAPIPFRSIYFRFIDLIRIRDATGAVESSAARSPFNLSAFDRVRLSASRN